MQDDDREAKRRFKASLDASVKFPQNLIDCKVYEHTLDNYVTHLDDAEKIGLFCEDPEDAEVDICELRDGQTAFTPLCVTDMSGITNCLAAGYTSGAYDPHCRLMFLRAADSRSPLNVTREMLTYGLTYLQAMPEFLDFVFTFGDQDFPRESQLGGFRYDSRSAEDDRGLRIRDFGRSGRRIQMCYNLRSPELSNPMSATQNWSVRQSAAYHSFDIEQGRATWIFVKGNDLMKKRTTSEARKRLHSNPGAYNSVLSSFASSLETHLILCDWAGENWRWYIRSMEEEVQKLSQRLQWTSVPDHTNYRPNLNTDSANALNIQPLRHQLTSLLVGNAKRAFTLKEKPDSMKEATITYVNQRSKFQFHHVQQLHSWEEKTNEALSILRTNIRILLSLKDYYEVTFDSKDFAGPIRSDCEQHIAKFAKRVQSIVHDLKMQASRLEVLVRLITDRKTLLYGLLEYYLAGKAQNSADKTQELTVEMNTIAKKTEESTISMKAITVVTLLFLPGTFISTFMSTDIIRFIPSHSGAPKRSYSSAALELYLEISIPLMAITILVWTVMYKWAKKTSEIERERDKRKNMGLMGSDNNV